MVALFRRKSGISAVRMKAQDQGLPNALILRSFARPQSFRLGRMNEPCLKGFKHKAQGAYPGDISPDSSVTILERLFFLTLPEAQIPPNAA